MLEHSPELDKLAAALAKAQGEIKAAIKDSRNPHFNAKYADLASVWDACRKPLSENGLSVVQWPGFERHEEGSVATCMTVLLHSSGQWMRAPSAAPLTKADAQGVGSCLTYLRRYALAAVAGVAPEDDDGNAASASNGHAQERTEERRPSGVDQNGVIRIPGDATKWDGHGGKALTDVPVDVLGKVRRWLDKKDPEKNKMLIAAIDQELARRMEQADEKRQTTDDESGDDFLAPPKALHGTAEDQANDRHIDSLFEQGAKQTAKASR